MEPHFRGHFQTPACQPTPKIGDDATEHRTLQSTECSPKAVRGMTEITAITKTVQRRWRSFVEKRALPGQVQTWDRALRPEDIPTGRKVRNTGGSYGRCRCQVHESNGGDASRTSRTPAAPEGESDILGEAGENPATDTSEESLRIRETDSDGRSSVSRWSPNGNHHGRFVDKSNVEGVTPGPPEGSGQTKRSKPSGAGSRGRSGFETTVEVSI